MIQTQRYREQDSGYKGAGGGWGGQRESMRGDRRGPDFGWWAHKRVHRCIIKSYPQGLLYIMLITSGAPITLIKNKTNTKAFISF